MPGYRFSGEEAKAVAAELREKANQSRDSAATYSHIGYRGHAASAEQQARTLEKAAVKVEKGYEVFDYEMKAYQG